MPDEQKPTGSEPMSSTLPAYLDDPARTMMTPALALWFDDRLFQRVTQIAGSLSKAEGVVPKHLINKPQTCFFVVEQALTWRLSPSYVARNCYETPNGQLGYHGQLCQAVLEVSGKLIGGVTFEHFGAWEKVQGKFTIKTSDRGGKYPVPTYTEEDEKGLGVIVRAQVKGEAEPRELTMYLRQCFPRNSTLWATDPKTQICYTAVRRFASVAAPGLFAGVPFDFEAGGMIDVTPPRPAREDFVEGTQAETSAPAAADQSAEASKPKAEGPTFDVATSDGEVKPYKRAADAVSFFEKQLRAAARVDGKTLEGLWESNGLILTQLRETERGASADMLGTLYTTLLAECDTREREAAKAHAAAGAREAETAKQGPQPQTAAAHQQDQEPAVVRWIFEHPGYKRVPSSPLKGGNWIAFLPWFCDQIREMPKDQIADFLSEEHFGHEFDFLAERRVSDYEEVKRLLAERGVKL